MVLFKGDARLSILKGHLSGSFGAALLTGLQSSLLGFVPETARPAAIETLDALQKVVHRLDAPSTVRVFNNAANATGRSLLSHLPSPNRSRLMRKAADLQAAVLEFNHQIGQEFVHQVQKAASISRHSRLEHAAESIHMAVRLFNNEVAPRVAAVISPRGPAPRDPSLSM